MQTMRTERIGRTKGKTASEQTTVLKTYRKEALRVESDDPVFAAALDIVFGRNAMFTGPTGGGKSIRSEALIISENYVELLKDTKLNGIEVQIEHKTVNLIPVLANQELEFTVNIENGNTSRTPTSIAEFIFAQGFCDRESYLEAEEKNNQVLISGKGTVRRYVLFIDDFDRVQHRSIPNAFMKFIEDARHEFSWHQERRFMNLQAVASSNSTAGSVSNKYLGSQGLDLAIHNRFQAYYVPDSSYLEILKSEFPELKHHGFIDKLCWMALDLKQEMTQGSFQDLGEITLRQLRPIVEQHILAGTPAFQAAGKLLSGIGVGNGQRDKADHVLNKYFGDIKRRAFAF